MIRGLLALTAACAAIGLAGSVRAADPPKLPSDDLFGNPQRSFHRFDDFVFTARERRTEATEKLARVRKALSAARLDALVIGTEHNLDWISAGGKDNVVWAQREAPVKVVVTSDKLYLVANNIETPRVMTEELAGLGYESIAFPWHGSEADALKPILRGKKVAFDLPATAAENGFDPARSSFDFADVYYPITSGEMKKYRWLGKKTSEILEQVADVVRPGMSERDVQYLLAREFWYWDIFPTVILSAVDERFKTYRHPVVVGAKLRNYVALNICARRWGLTVSTTRLVQFGTPDPSLKRAWDNGPKVQAAMWAASRPGKTLGDVLAAAQKAYRDIGFTEEWRLHHQGGMIMGQERLYLAAPGDKRKIVPGMVLAWNPTVQGTKFEDTVMIKDDGSIENFTLPSSSRWPTVEVSAGGLKYRIPVLKVRTTPSE